MDAPTCTSCGLPVDLGASAEHRMTGQLGAFGAVRHRMDVLTAIVSTLVTVLGWYVLISRYWEVAHA